MRRMLLVLALLLLTTLPAHAQSPPNAHVTQVDSSQYPDVTIYVGVTDAGGQPIAGLTERDFAIAEDGQPVEISAFVGGGASPVTTMLVIDRSGSMEESDKIAGAREAASAFVEQMRPGDRTGLIAFNSQSRTVQDFTASRNDLAEAIGRIRPDGGTDGSETFTPTGDLVNLISTLANGDGLNFELISQDQDSGVAGVQGTNANAVAIDVSDVIKGITSFDLTKLSIFDNVLLAVDGLDQVLALPLSRIMSPPRLNEPSNATLPGRSSTLMS